jgi:hypothetical protein
MTSPYQKTPRRGTPVKQENLKGVLIMSKITTLQKGQEIDWENWLESFILDRKADGLSPRTIKDYNDHVGV